MNLDNLVRYLVGAWVLLMFVGFAIVAWRKSQDDKERIRDYLLDRGYGKIVIRYEWFDFDKSNATYQVECVNSKGIRTRTTCKIHRAAGWDQNIYWQDPM